MPSVEGWYWIRAIKADGDPDAFKEIVFVGLRGAALFVSRAGVGGCIPLQDFAKFEFKGPLQET